MWILLGVVLGFALGWIVTSGGALIYGELAHVSQFEGAYAMGAVFALGPMGGLIGAVIGVFLGARRQRSRATRTDR
ncbi:hypothetical protein KPL78_15200 [Roseomonas sp. HJA6]|uniref:Major facilitator superfamily (MFS) profile domain-containing protein n=1 Tax=Roseomonas alba TaxID=2846776 RepID=A0ABS7AA84_9PROT|nr:hypothetical protein [Neoroseomonas alba]MBW6399208.1 hypothetical protein [Neoroseomonas alba]